MEDAFEGYPVVMEIPVAWGEMDFHRHVNNTVYFRYFESSRFAYFEKMASLGPEEAVGVGRILASTSCRFKAPLFYPDKVLVGARVTEMGTDRFTFTHRIVSTSRSQIVADGQAVIVTFDYGKNRKVPLPETWRLRVCSIEGLCDRASTP